MEAVALGFVFATALQTALIAGGTWVFQEPEKRLIRTKGLWPGLATYAWVAAAVVAATLLGGTVAGGALWWVLAMTVLGLTFRQTLKIGIASAILIYALGVVLPAGEPPVAPETGASGERSG